MLTRRARKNWAVELRDYIEMWSEREERVVVEDPNRVFTSSAEELDVSEDYTPWFDSITRRYIQPQFDNWLGSSYNPSSHTIPRSAKRWISSARAAARTFMDPLSTEHSKEDAYTIFQNALAELTETGFEAFLGVDPRHIEWPPCEWNTGQGGDWTQEFPEPDITQHSSQMTDDEAGPSTTPTPQPRRGRHRRAPDKYTPGSIRHGRGHQ